MPTTLHENRPSAGIGVVEVQEPMVFFCDFCGARATLCGDRRGRGAKTHGFFAISNMPARPSAGIGVVEVQKPMVFCDFQHARATLCGDRRGRGAKTIVFCDFQHARATLCGDRRGRGAKTHGFLRCPTCPRDPLRDRRGRGAKTRACPRDPLRGSAWSRCKNSRFFATFVFRTGPRELSRGSRACSRNRRVAGSIPPWSAGGRHKMQPAF